MIDMDLRLDGCVWFGHWCVIVIILMTTLHDLLLVQTYFVSRYMRNDGLHATVTNILAIFVYLNP